MGNIERRLERLEDRLIPKEIILPYPTKTMSEEWLQEFRKMFEEGYQKYRWSYEPNRTKN